MTEGVRALNDLIRPSVRTGAPSPKGEGLGDTTLKAPLVKGGCPEGAGGFRQAESFRDSESPSHRLAAATAPFNKGAFEGCTPS